MSQNDVLRLEKAGLYCPAGDFYIDPWAPVGRALITHGHSDHARVGHHTYVATRASEPILRHRLGEIDVTPVRFGDTMNIGDALVSFHPAGHVLGSAQIRVEVDGKVWVVTGDYKREDDESCEAFELVPCDTLVTEATFALPIYRWDPGERVVAEILSWWRDNRAQGTTSILFCYALGKAQRLLAELEPHVDGPVFLHGAMAAMVDIYRQSNRRLAPTALVADQPKSEKFKGELVIAPPSAMGTTWMRRFTNPSTAFVSGWMRVRGQRRRRGYDRGFVLSDHVDWPDLLRTIEETGASRVLPTHGYTDILARYLVERGLDAVPLETAFEGESES
ncbi:MAG: ligase-associated DNA damage response exonuclease [Geminicoccaceae bacterium]